MSRTPARMAALALSLALSLALGLTALAAGGLAGSTAVGAQGAHPSSVRHVLLLSIDGMHQSDLTWYIAHHPGSALAQLTNSGAEFTGAQTPVPSDSFPGMVGQATGGNPSSTGIFYDDSYNHALLPAGTTPANCATATPGVEVTYFEAADKNPHALDAGQGLSGLPDSILSMTANPDQVIDPATLPVDPASCQPVYPHSYLRVNTMFEVARTAGLRTAWSDKHAAYEVLNGPSGTGVQDLFTPEINSDAPASPSSNDWTTVNTLTQQYDSYKVQAVINEINGFDHSGTTQVGTPAIFGMNFQTVSTAEKLAMSVTATSGSTQLPGGYLSGGQTPGPVLSGALDFVDAKLGAMVAAIKSAGLEQSTAIVLSAKHGQSPQDPNLLTRIDDGPIIDALNAAWASAHPSATAPLVAFAIDDDGMLMWLNDRSATATQFAKNFLLGYSGTGNDVNGQSKAFTQSGLAQAFAGDQAAAYFGTQPGDPRVPDLFGIAQVGVVYTGHKAKIAEHGGANPQDRDVPLVVSGAGVAHHHVNDDRVETTQIAPTILDLLGLDPNLLQAVQIEHTPVLPLGRP